MKTYSNKIEVDSNNEWDPLHVVAVGQARQHKWPKDDDFFNQGIKSSTFPGEFDYDIPTWLIEEAENDLLDLCETLDKENITVVRPSTDSYNARDIMMVIGKDVFVSPTPYEYRSIEYEKYQHIFDLKKIKIIKKQNDMFFDAANVARFDDKLLFLISSTGTTAGADHLQNVVGSNYEVIQWKDVYAHAHIDSTLLPLNDHTILCNASRVKEETLPRFLKHWKKIWVEDVKERNYYKFPYASKWIGCNVLSINPDTVIIDSIQTRLKEQLEEQGFRVLTVPMRHSRTLGGGLHCTTLDLVRKK